MIGTKYARLEDLIRSGINLEHSQPFVRCLSKMSQSGLVMTRGGEVDPEASLKKGLSITHLNS